MPIRFHKTRIAPTPSGLLHQGNAFSFLLTQELAAEHGATLLLRIDDMDRERVRPGYVQHIFDTLRFLGIAWQEGPRDAEDFERHWSQHRRLPLYDALLRQLANERKVFACTCSRADILRQRPDGVYPGTCLNKELPLDTPGASWRLRTDDDSALTVFLRSGELIQARLPESQQHFIVRKKDGFPAYQLSSLCDDVHFGTDLIVRGADLWDSTLAQLYLARVARQEGFLRTAFVHHPLIAGAGGEKLSKSAGAAALAKERPQAFEALRAQYVAWRDGFSC